MEEEDNNIIPMSSALLSVRLHNSSRIFTRARTHDNLDRNQDICMHVNILIFSSGCTISPVQWSHIISGESCPTGL